MQVLLVGREMLHERGRHALGVFGQSHVGMVAGILEHAYFVFYLHHYHRAVLVVVGHMTKPCAESVAVGIKHGGRKGGGYLQRLAGGGAGTREALRIGLEPLGSIAAHGVFPGAEPQEHHFDAVAPGLVYHLVGEREVELPFRRLGEFPICGHKHRVEVHPFELREDGFDVGVAGGGRIAELAAEYHERLAVDTQPRRRALAFKARFGRGCKDGRGRYDCD